LAVTAGAQLGVTAALNASEWIGIAAIVMPITLGFIAWLSRLANRTSQLEGDMTDLKADVKEMRAEQRGFRDSLTRIEIVMEKGFATITEQIKTLFKNEDKH